MQQIFGIDFKILKNYLLAVRWGLIFTHPLNHERAKNPVMMRAAKIIEYQIPNPITINGAVAVMNPPPKNGS